MFNIAVCDDSSYLRNELKQHLIAYALEKDMELQIYEYETGELLLEAERTDKVVHDLIFIDYEFEDKGQNGIAIIRALRKFKKNTKVIFLSSYTQVVFQSFEVQPFRFLVKPIDDPKLFQAMDDFVHSLTTDSVLCVRIKGENRYYPEEEITFVEGNGKNCILHFVEQQEIICNETLSSMQHRLSQNRFFRCHKSYLVNLGHVDSYRHKDVSLDCGELLLISRNKYKEFGDALMKFMMQQRGL